MIRQKFKFGDKKNQFLKKKSKINKNVFEGTKKRLIFCNMFTIWLFMLIFSVFLYAYFHKVTYTEIDNKINAEYNNIITSDDEGGELEPNLILYPQNLVYIYKEGVIQYYTQNQYFGSTLPKVRADLDGSFINYKANGYYFREMNIKTGQYFIQIVRNIDAEKNALKQILNILTMSGFASLIISYIIANYLMRKSLQSIEHTWNNQVNFIQDASHELRTPVSVVQSKLESLLKTPDMTVADRIDDIASAMSEIRRLNKMIKDMLSLTKEDSIVKLNINEFEMLKLLDELYENYSEFAQFQSKNFRIRNYTELETIAVKSDRGKIKQILIILIDNAFKYTNEDDFIELSIFKTRKDHISIAVEDSGRGIKEEELAYIFDRFYRSDKVRAEDIEGSGIGLSIAKMLSQNISGELSVASKLGTGSKFTLEIPNRIK